MHYAVGSGAMTLFVVREYDPYIGRRIDSDLEYLSDDNTPPDNGDRSSSELNDEDGDNDDDDATDGEFEEQNDITSSDSDGAAVEVDENKYPNFNLRQEYKTMQSFKSVISRYAVRKMSDFKYKKSDSKYVVANFHIISALGGFHLSIAAILGGC